MIDWLNGSEWVSLLSILAITGVLTEVGKRLARPRLRKCGDTCPRALSLLIGSALGWLAWPAGSELSGWFVGAGIGASASTLHWIVVSIVKSKWPEAAATLTGRKA